MLSPDQRKLPLSVYVPTRHLGIAEGSGIVGAQSVDMVHVYYEGNLYDASNIVTWADRIDHAADRLVANYPTIAQMVTDAEDLTRVGTWDGKQVTLLDNVAANIVYEWLRLHERGEHALDDECLPTRLLNITGRMES